MSETEKKYELMESKLINPKLFKTIFISSIISYKQDFQSLNRYPFVIEGENEAHNFINNFFFFDSSTISSQTNKSKYSLFTAILASQYVASSGDKSKATEDLVMFCYNMCKKMLLDVQAQSLTKELFVNKIINQCSSLVQEGAQTQLALNLLCLLAKDYPQELTQVSQTLNHQLYEETISQMLISWPPGAKEFLEAFIPESNRHLKLLNFQYKFLSSAAASKFILSNFTGWDEEKYLPILLNENRSIEQVDLLMSSVFKSQKISRACNNFDDIIKSYTEKSDMSQDFKLKVLTKIFSPSLLMSNYSFRSWVLSILSAKSTNIDSLNIVELISTHYEKVSIVPAISYNLYIEEVFKSLTSPKFKDILTDEQIQDVLVARVIYFVKNKHTEEALQYSSFSDICSAYPEFKVKLIKSLVKNNLLLSACNILSTDPSAATTCSLLDEETSDKLLSRYKKILQNSPQSPLNETQTSTALNILPQASNTARQEINSYALAPLQTLSSFTNCYKENKNYNAFLRQALGAQWSTQLIQKIDSILKGLSPPTAFLDQTKLVDINRHLKNCLDNNNSPQISKVIEDYFHSHYNQKQATTAGVEQMIQDALAIINSCSVLSPESRDSLVKKTLSLIDLENPESFPTSLFPKLGAYNTSSNWDKQTNLILNLSAPDLHEFREKLFVAYSQRDPKSIYTLVQSQHLDADLKKVLEEFVSKQLSSNICPVFIINNLLLPMQQIDPQSELNYDNYTSSYRSITNGKEVSERDDVAYYVYYGKLALKTQLISLTSTLCRSMINEGSDVHINTQSLSDLKAILQRVNSCSLKGFGVSDKNRTQYLNNLSQSIYDFFSILCPSIANSISSSIGLDKKCYKNKDCYDAQSTYLLTKEEIAQLDQNYSKQSILTKLMDPESDSYYRKNIPEQKRLKNLIDPNNKQFIRLTEESVQLLDKKEKTMSNTAVQEKAGQIYAANSDKINQVRQTLSILADAQLDASLEYKIKADAICSAHISFIKELDKINYQDMSEDLHFLKNGLQTFLLQSAQQYHNALQKLHAMEKEKTSAMSRYFKASLADFDPIAQKEKIDSQALTHLELLSQRLDQCKSSIASSISTDTSKEMAVTTSLLQQQLNKHRPPPSSNVIKLG